MRNKAVFRFNSFILAAWPSWISRACFGCLQIRDGPTKEMLAIAAAKEANRKAAEHKLATAAPFKLCIVERPTNIERIRMEIEADLARELTFRPAPARAVPAPPVAPVKLNTAAILREDAVYRKKQAQEAEMLKKFESELHDAGEFKVGTVQESDGGRYHKRQCVRVQKETLLCLFWRRHGRPSGSFSLACNIRHGCFRGCAQAPEILSEKTSSCFCLQIGGMIKRGLMCSPKRASKLRMLHSLPTAPPCSLLMCSLQAWQSKMLQLDEEKRAAEIERRRQEMVESGKAAIRARERNVEENQAIGRALKAEAKAIEETLARDREEARLAKAALRDAVLDTRSAAALAAEKVGSVFSKSCALLL